MGRSWTGQDNAVIGLEGLAFWFGCVFLALESSVNGFGQNLVPDKEDVIDPFFEQRHGIFVQLGSVEVERVACRVVELLDSVVADKDNVCVGPLLNYFQGLDNFNPVCQSVLVALGVADFLDGIDLCLGAHLLPDKPFHCVECIDSNGFIRLPKRPTKLVVELVV